MSLVDRHIERRELARAKAKARREHPQPCDCSLCITPERVDAIIKARVAAARDLLGEAPF